VSSERLQPIVRTGFFLHVMPAILYVVAIFYAGSVGNPPVPRVFASADKLLHALAFLGMQCAIWRAVRWQWPSAGLIRQLTIALILTCLFGALLEVWQAALPHRTAELADWFADALGGVFGAGLLWLVYGRSEQAQK